MCDLNGKKILFTTVYNNGQYINDHFADHTRRTFFRYSFPKINSFGLRFIKENIPQIDILEYPVWDEYKKAVQNYDIIGFSFLMNETEDILKMAKYARKQGKELWAGNYGAMTPHIRKNFDRTFLGYSEHELADLLGLTIDSIKHPIMPMYITLPLGLKINQIGILFTTRGCNKKCAFCQTPNFCSKIDKLDMNEIERILIKYKNMGVSEILIFDENFGVLPKHSDDVTKLIEKYGFYWFCMTRADQLRPALDKWEKRGLIGAFVGIENFGQENLESVGKNESTEDIWELMTELRKRRIFTLGHYIIGFENETEKSIRRDVKRLSSLELDVNHISIITPLPETPLWDDYSRRFGIFEKDYSKYDTKHLVWHHPKIPKKKMNRLIDWAFKTAYPRKRMFQTGMKMHLNYMQKKGIIGGTRYMVEKAFMATIFDYSRYL